MIRQRGILALFVVAIVVAACGSESTTPSASTAQADVSLAPFASSSPSTAPTPSPKPLATSTAKPAPTAVPTASPTPTPTPTPWLTYKSKRNRYSIKYPPGWVVTPGTADISDQFDGFDYPYVYVSRDTVPTGSYVSVSKTVTHDIAYWKSHFKATLTSNKAVKIAGWSGRLLTFRGTDDGRTIFFQHLILAKGRVAYFLDMYGKNEAAVADRALFKRIYTTWRPT